MSPGSRPPPRRQRGFGLLVTLLVLVLGAATFFVSARGPARDGDSPDTDASLSLAAARDAVLAYAQYGGSNNKPGALPCPDTSDPADTANSGRAGSHCQGSPDPVYIGRLPWRTIDFAQAAGSADALAWYAIDGDYQDDPDDPLELNAETPAELEVLAADGGPPGVPRVAVLVLPGDPLEGQTGRPGTDVSDYLEGENADGDTVFRDCAGLDDCNDRVIGIPRDRLFAGVQRRVLARVAERLVDFHDDQGHLPYAAAFTGGASCDDGVKLGRLALDEGDCGTGESLLPSDFSGDDEWIVDNAWDELTVYHVADACTEAVSDCPAGDLVLDDDAGLGVVLAGAGSAHAGQDRPGDAAGDYLDSAENRDGDATYVDGPLTASDNDVLRGAAFAP